MNNLLATTYQRSIIIPFGKEKVVLREVENDLYKQIIQK